jgi:dolichol-phosphate mannosyltransferase
MTALLEFGSHLGYEILFVNDGSTDGSGGALLDFHQADLRVKVIELSRNFGHQMALSAGIDHASGDAVILMDGDLQDPPEMIPRLVEKWAQGFDVVYAVRIKRKEGFLKRMTFSAFYRLLQALSTTQMPLDAGIFSLMDRKVVDVLKAMPERNRYLTGLRAWTGFRHAGIPCERGERFAGQPRQTLSRLLKLALDGIFSFSYLPLRAATVIGVAVSLLAFLTGLYALYAKLFTTKAISGWASMLVATTLLGGLILLMLGLIGEYLARIYDEVKARPAYVIARKVGFQSRSESHG